MSDVLTYEALKIERDRFQQISEQTLQVKLQMAETIKGLLAENAAMREAIDFATAKDMWIEQHDGMLDYRYSEWYVDVLNAAIETPATYAALAAVRAQAIEDAVKQVLSVDTVASTIVISQLLRLYAAELREAK